jgi:hypothetical protein
MPKAIVSSPFLGIRKHIVRLAYLLKLFLRRGVSWVFVGMELDRHLAVGALDFLGRSRFGNLQHFIIVSLRCHEWVER